MNDKKMGVLCHALGLSERNKTQYRNHYVAGEGHHSWEAIQSLIEDGLMFRNDRISGGPLCGSGDCFHVTEKGEALALEHIKETAPKLTRGQRRYREYLRLADFSGMTFGEWLKSGAA